jgi:hypothetical protein
MDLQWLKDEMTYTADGFERYGGAPASVIERLRHLVSLSDEELDLVLS